MTGRNEEQSDEEYLSELIENRDGRFVLIGTRGGAATGDAMIFEPRTRMLHRFDEADELRRDVVMKMFAAGATVLPMVPPWSPISDDARANDITQ